MVIDEKTGATLIVEDLCNGCGLCAEACPFNKKGTVIKFDPKRKVYFKCDLCGGKPACVDVCPTGALKLKEVRR